MKNFYLSCISILFIHAQSIYSQSFTASWPMANDSLSIVSGNVTAPGIQIDPTLFTRLRSYGPAGLKGMGTNGKTATPACGPQYNSAGATTPISPYMEWNFSPNSGYSAAVNAFSFTVTGDSLTSASMVLAVGYSTDGGTNFTGMDVTKNGVSISPAPGTTGTSITTGDVFIFSAPSTTISAGSSLIVRMMYWKNATATTSGNRIVVSGLTITGTTNPATSTPTLSTPNPASLTGFDYQMGNGPSGIQSFSVSGSNLTNEIAVNASASYEISTNVTSGFTSNILLTPVAGAVSSSLIYVRLKAGLSVGSYNEAITLSSTGATAHTINCQGTVASAPLPAITVTPAMLTGFSYQLGAGPSAEQMVNISGANLTGNVNIIATSSFEISLTSGVGFTDAISLTPTSAAIPVTSVYVRLKNSLGVANYNEQLMVSASGATSVNIMVSGSVYVPPPAGTTSYTETFAINSLGNLGTSYYNDTFSTVSKWGLWNRNNVGLTNLNGMPGSADTRCPKFRTSLPGTYVETPELRGVYSISYSVSESSGVTDTMTLSDGGTLNSQYIYNSSTTTPPTYLTVPVPVISSANNNGHYRFTFGAAVATHYLDNIKFLFVKPTTQASVVTAVKNADETQMTIQWTRPNNGQDNQGSIVFVGEGNFIAPTSGVSYPDNTTYGNAASALGTFYCVYSDTGNSMTVTGLTPGVAYQVYVLEYNGIPGQNDENYNTTQPAYTETCGTLTAYVEEKRTILTGSVLAADFTIHGTSDAIITYNIAGGAPMQVTLTNSTATIHIDSITESTDLNIVSIQKGLCSNALSVTSTVSVTPLVMNSKPDINGFNAYPNPSTGGALKVKMTEREAGKYAVRITSNTGHVLFMGDIQHPGGSAVYTITYGTQAAIGIYNLEIINISKGVKSVQSIIIAD